MQETQLQSLGQEEPLEKGMVTHSSILAWRIPWTKEPDRLQSMGRQESDKTEDIYIYTLHARPFLKFFISVNLLNFYCNPDVGTITILLMKQLRHRHERPCPRSPDSQLQNWGNTYAVWFQGPRSYLRLSLFLNSAYITWFQPQNWLCSPTPVLDPLCSSASLDFLPGNTELLWKTWAKAQQRGPTKYQTLSDTTPCVYQPLFIKVQHFSAWMPGMWKAHSTSSGCWCRGVVEKRSHGLEARRGGKRQQRRGSGTQRPQTLRGLVASCSHLCIKHGHGAFVDTGKCDFLHPSPGGQPANWRMSPGVEKN